MFLLPVSNGSLLYGISEDQNLDSSNRTHGSYKYRIRATIIVPHQVFASKTACMTLALFNRGLLAGSSKVEGRTKAKWVI